MPYIVHPFEVAQILFDAGSDTKVIIAGLLHDTVEDAGVSINEIRETFGPEVASFVDFCSEDKMKTWEERKGHTISLLSKVTDINVMMLICADKLSNLKSMESDCQKEGENIWKRFNRGKEKQRWYYKSIIDNLTPIKDTSMYKKLEVAFASVFQNTVFSKCN